jgi:N-methylhydantoinase A
MPFGGSGALHTGALMKDVGLSAALVPRFPGVTSALGCVVADMRHDRVQTVNQLVDAVDAAALGRQISQAADNLAGLLDNAGIAFDSVARIFELDMLYVGQTHTVSVPLAIPDKGLTREAIQSAFDDAYGQAFGRLLANIPARIMNYRVAALGKRPRFDMTAFAPVDGKSARECKTGEREIFVNGGSTVAAIYDRLALAEGETVLGPAILEQPDSTIFVDPGLVGRIDRFGNLIIEYGAQ